MKPTLKKISIWLIVVLHRFQLMDVRTINGLGLIALGLTGLIPTPGVISAAAHGDTTGLTFLASIVVYFVTCGILLLILKEPSLRQEIFLYSPLLFFAVIVCLSYGSHPEIFRYNPSFPILTIIHVWTVGSYVWEHRRQSNRERVR